MGKRGTGATLAQLALLAVPFVIASVWLDLTVPSFGAARMVQGALCGVLLAAAVVLTSRCLGRVGVIVGVVLYVPVLLLLAADAASWFMQGSSFNERFFVHVNTDNIRVSLQAYPWALAGVVVVLVLAITGAAWVLLHASRRKASPAALLPVLAMVALVLVLDAPPHRLYGYFANAERTQGLATSSTGERIRAMLDMQPSRPDQVVAKPGRNLVFIYLESVERTYTDAARFPGLTPRIDALRRHGLDFSGFATFPGVTYTISGIFSSQCGAPYLINSIFGDDFGKLGFVPNNDNTTASSFHPQLACLGDVLHAAGYDQTYLSGVTLSFANTDVFFHMHGYDRALGRPQIEQLHDGALPTEGWGLLDSDMFDQALATYRRGQASGKPFSVVFSTIDTHPPEGYMLPGCQPYAPIRNSMLDAVHCTDQLLGRFIDQLSREPGYSSTVVVVMSDHVSMRNVASPLYPPDDQRQPLLFVLGAGQGERAARMYHMDIAPTVLDLLGVDSNVRFMAGADRAAPHAADSPLPADDVAKAVLRDVLWKDRPGPAICEGGSLVRWDAEVHGLELGGWKLPLMLGGFPVDHVGDAQTLLVFVDDKTAQLQILPRGGAREWLQRARVQHGSIFNATPFMDDQGHRALALDWLAPKGGWASLGKVERLQDLMLKSPRCEALVHEVAAAPSGTRLDLSAAFGTARVPAASEVRPGQLVSAHVPADASPAALDAFMFGRMRDERAGSGTIHINHQQRIALAPAQGREAMAEFDVSGLAALRVLPRVDNLLGSCLRRSDTGIVGVRLSLDGRLVVPRFIVDRHYDGTLELATDGAKVLRVDVDKGNAIADCDYFDLGFADIVAAKAGSPAAPAVSGMTPR